MSQARWQRTVKLWYVQAHQYPVCDIPDCVNSKWFVYILIPYSMRAEFVWGHLYSGIVRTSDELRKGQTSYRLLTRWKTCTRNVYARTKSLSPSISRHHSCEMTRDWKGRFKGDLNLERISRTRCRYTVWKNRVDHCHKGIIRLHFFWQNRAAWVARDTRVCLTAICAVIGILVFCTVCQTIWCSLLDYC